MANLSFGQRGPFKISQRSRFHFIYPLRPLVELRYFETFIGGGPLRYGPYYAPWYRKSSLPDRRTFRILGFWLLHPDHPFVVNLFYWVFLDYLKVTGLHQDAWIYYS